MNDNIAQTTMNKVDLILCKLMRLCAAFLIACVTYYMPTAFADDAHELHKLIKIPLTTEEREWLAQHPVIRVGVRHSYKPIEFLSEGNQFRGITMDYLHLLEAPLGVKFEKHDLQDDATSESIDMLSSVSNPESLYGSGFEMLKPFLEFRYAIYTHNTNKQFSGTYALAGKHVAVFKHGMLAKKLGRKHPDLSLLKVDLAEEAFRALEQKNVDAYIGNEMVVDYEISVQGLNFIHKAGYYPDTSKLSMAVRSDWHMLIAILNKSFDALQPHQNAILDAWDGSKDYDNKYYLFGAIGVLVLLGIILLVHDLQLKRVLREQEKQAQEMIWRQANYDHLTNLPNRMMFNKLLEEEIEKSQTDGSRFGLLFIDLDHFKQVNDHHGHWTGDQLLVETAHRIQRSLPDNDVAARLAGDEFTLLLRNISNVKTIETVANNLIKRFEKPFHIGNQSIQISASIGGAIFPDNADTHNEIMKYADQAMYEAKRNGRNQLQMFTKSMQRADIMRTSMSQELRKSIKNKQLSLVYQPIVALATKKIVKAEALLRWEHPDLGMVGPQTFIPIAEEIGMIQPIGQWLFEQAMHDLDKLRAQFGADFEISINVSPNQFSSAGNLLQWPEQLAKAKLSSGINIEITEGTMLDSSELIGNTLELLRAAGMQLIIDDFGTGYSALSYLKKFNIDYLKLDASFVRQIESNPHDMILCESIIQMAHKLNIRVIAEAIETEGQRKILRKLKCDFGQGHLFCHPKTLKELLLLN